jgi:endonuclease/exonuclease/phosphatase family metal-dependent hydrolase
MRNTLHITKTILLGFLLLPTWTFALEFQIGQAVILKSPKVIGVPLHHEAAPSYWKHIPNKSLGTVQELSSDHKWIFIGLESGENGWVKPKFVQSHSPTTTNSTTKPSTTTPRTSSSEFPQTLHASSKEEEALVWSSRKGCEQVVQEGGRMVLPSSEQLRVGTWNIRWFPYGHPPGQSRKTDGDTDVPWMICTITWMNVDVLAVQESLDTSLANQAWKTILASLEQTTGHSWRWILQRCGEPDSHKIGFLWDTQRVDLTLPKSLWTFNVKSPSNGKPCEGGLRPGHYAYVQARQQAGADFHLIALHLKSGPTVFALEDRQKALNRIDKTVSPFLATDQDVVILGDFNTMGAGDNASRLSELKYVRRMVSKEMPGFQDLPLVPQCSHYFRGRGGWLDHVLVNHGMEEVRTRSARVTGYCAITACERISGDYPLAYQRLSDHCPVVMEIQNQDQD